MDSDNDIKPVGSYPSTGIDILVIGTGLAGLTAAIECARKGHNVRILERDSHINTAGNAQCNAIEDVSKQRSRRYVLHGKEWDQILKALARNEG